MGEFMSYTQILNALTGLLIIEGLTLAYIVYTEGYSDKAFMIMGFMIMLKLSQIQTIIMNK